MQKGSALPLVLVGILLVILIGAGGYYFYNQQKLNNVTDYTSCVKAGNPILEDVYFACKTPNGKVYYQKGYERQANDTTSESALIDETADWKTYTDIKYGYSLKYPPDFTIEEDQAFVQFLSNNIKFPDEESPIGEIDAGGHIIITVSESEFRTLDEFVNTYRANESFSEFNKSQLDGIAAWKFIFRPARDIEKEDQQLVSLKNGKEYSILLSTSKADKEKMGKIFDQILSTFKFLDDETVNWKTYRTNDFSLLYPTNWRISTSSENPAHILTLQSADYSPVKESSNQKQQGMSISLFKGQIPWETGKKIGEQLGPKSIEETTWAGQEALLEEYDYEGEHLVLTTKFNNINYQMVTIYTEGRNKLQDKKTFLQIANSIKLLK